MTRRIAHVVPLLRMPLGSGFFDYAVPDTLTHTICAGMLVSIPFRNASLQGIVWEVSDEIHVATGLKMIDCVVKEYDYVSSRQRSFLAWFAQRHIISLPSACDTFIPRQPRRRVRASRALSPLSLTIHSSPIVQPLTDHGLIVVPTWNELIGAIFQCCGNLTDSQQLLILCPSVHDLEAIASQLRATYGQRMIVVTGNLGMSALANAYELLARGLCDIVLSTRSALAWNLPSLARIVMVHPESRDYKQYDHNPRYDARMLAEYWHRELACPITYLSSTPSCEMLDESHTQEICARSTPLNQKSTTHLVNLLHEFKSGNATFVSDILAEQIQRAHDQEKNALLYVRAKGYSGTVRCEQCNDIALCTACVLPMRYSLRDNMLRCVSCAEMRTLPSACPRCHSHGYDFRGLGIEKIASSLTKRFTAARIVEISADHTNDESIIEMILTGTRVIVLGTSHLFTNYWRWIDRIGAIGIISADPLPSSLDFRSSEYQWQTMMRLTRIADTFSLPFIIQAFNVESVPITSLSGRDWKCFADWQCRQRKNFHWPPYARVIKILARHHTKLQPDSVDWLIRDARNALSPLRENVALFRTRAMHYESRPYILIRIEGHYSRLDRLPRELEEFLQRLATDWLIDIDPVTF